jgi:DNA-binding NarL/FixJ family response regulator
MQRVFLQILFLGEKSSSWHKVSELLAQPDASIHVHPVDSLADLFQALALGRWQAVAIDVHAWNFQGLHYIEKVRSEYPALPIIALFSRSIPELDTKATTCGASGCIALDHLTATALHNAVCSALEDVESQFFLDRDLQTHLPANDSGTPALTFTKNQVITHALNNLLCVISANADLLSDSLDGSSSDSHPLSEIKKATRSAAALLRHLK